MKPIVCALLLLVSTVIAWQRKRFRDHEVLGALQETTVSDVEGFSEQSCQGLGVYRFLRGANREK